MANFLFVLKNQTYLVGIAEITDENTCWICIDEARRSENFPNLANAVNNAFLPLGDGILINRDAISYVVPLPKTWDSLFSNKQTPSLKGKTATVNTTKKKLSEGAFVYFGRVYINQNLIYTTRNYATRDVARKDALKWMKDNDLQEEYQA